MSHITFALDDVKVASEAPATRELGESMGEVLCLGANSSARVINIGHVHPLLAAVHAAFAEHRPLVLSPDVVWLTIAQGLAQHVRLNAEALRERLVRHRGKESITVVHRGAMPRDAASWATFIDAFRAGVARHTGDGLARLFTCDFSTTTDVERVASEIILLDAVSPYFDLRLACVCGIPEITLLGTPKDWRAIRERIDVVAELDLAWWTQSLAPIADHFVKAAEGAPDLAHWKRIYKPRDAYSEETITGWIARLYPYVKNQGKLNARNSLLALPVDEPRDSADKWYAGPGIKLGDAPGGLSSARVRVTDDVTDTRLETSIEGGILGVAFDGRALAPIAGYVVRVQAASILDVLDAIERDHQVTRPVAEGRHGWGGTAEMLAMRDRFSSATLFPGERAWRIRPTSAWEHVDLKLPSGTSVGVTRFIDLPNGKSIAMAENFGASSAVYVMCDASSVRVEDVPVVAKSLAALLAHALASKGGAELPSLGSYADHLPAWIMNLRVE